MLVLVIPPPLLPLIYCYWTYYYYYYCYNYCIICIYTATQDEQIQKRLVVEPCWPAIYIHLYIYTSQFLFTSQLNYTSKAAFPCYCYCCCNIDHLLQFLHQTIPGSIISKANSVCIWTFGTHRQGIAMSLW